VSSLRLVIAWSGYGSDFLSARFRTRPADVPAASDLDHVDDLQQHRRRRRLRRWSRRRRRRRLLLGSHLAVTLIDGPVDLAANWPEVDFLWNWSALKWWPMMNKVWQWPLTNVTDQTIEYSSMSEIFWSGMSSPVCLTGMGAIKLLVPFQNSCKIPIKTGFMTSWKHQYSNLTSL